MAELEPTTLASVLASVVSLSGNQDAANQLINSNQLTSPLDQASSVAMPMASSNISEEVELKMLNFPSKREDLTTAIPLTVIFALLLVTGCIGNLCTAIVIARPKNKYMHTATNYYLFSLAMSDFLFLILGLPQEMYTLWQRYPYAFGESFCIIRGYLSEASTYASILTISAFTIERYVAICHPLWAHTMSQLPRAITSIVIIWILSAICAIPPAAELGIVTQKGPLTNRTLEESAQCAAKRTIYENMFVVSAIVFFIVPMIIVTVLYILIALELRRSSRMNSAISKQTSSQLHQSSNSTHQATQPTSSTSCGLLSQLNQPPCYHNHIHHHLHHRHHRHNHHGHGHNHPHNHRHKNKPNNQLQQGQHSERDEKASTAHLSTGSSNTCLNLPLSSVGCRSAVGERRLENYRVQSPAFSLCLSVEQVNNKADNVNNDTSQQQHELFGKQDTLMSNLMSGRPSSAIGNEQLLAQPIKSGHQELLLGRFKRSPLSLWPLLWHNNSNKQPDRGAACQACCCHLRANKQCALPISNNGNNNNNLNPRVTLNEPQSATPDGSLESTRPHSPLSYHESLISRTGGGHQHQHQQLRHKQLLGQPQDAASVKQRQFQMAHQMSLPHSPSIHSNGSQTAQSQFKPNCHLPMGSVYASNATINSHNHNHNHHQHQQNGHTQHGAGGQQTSRRSTAASSKKSVIRMLVAVVVSFFICWVPFHSQRCLASYLVKMENRNLLLLDIYLKLTYISGVMYYLSSTINPLLYQLMSAKFRLAFKETFHCSLFRCAMFLRGSSSNLATNNKSSLKESTMLHHHHRHHRCASHNSHNGSHNGSHESQRGRQSQLHQALVAPDSTVSNEAALQAPQKPPPHPSSDELSNVVKSRCSNCHLAGSNSANSTALNQQAGTLEWPKVGPDCTGNHLAGHTPNWEPRELPQQQTSRFNVINRLRSKLNTSLVSLFRLNSGSSGTGLSCHQASCCQACACCAVPGSSGLSAQTIVQPTNTAYSSSNCSCNCNCNTGHSAQIRARCVSPMATNCPGNNDNRKEACQAGTNKQSSSSPCAASTPLLLSHQQESQLESNQANHFPAHSMLKFIKAPQCGAQAGNKPNSSSQQALSRLSSRSNVDEDEPSRPAQKSDNQVRDEDRMSALIKATNDEAIEDEFSHTRDHFSMSSESGNSSGSSPDQQQVVKLASSAQSKSQANKFLLSRQQQMVQKRSKVSSCSSNGSDNDRNNSIEGQHCRNRASYDANNNSNSNRNNNNNKNNASAEAERRRASLQQRLISGQLALTPSRTGKTLPVYIEKEKKQSVTRQLSDNDNERRKSYSSSNRHLSSSLSSSERQLDKKLSVSTTTSALEDCTSFTTTNSQLTSGSNPTLGNRLGTDFCLEQCSAEISAIEEDLPTAIPSELVEGARNGQGCQLASGLNSIDCCNGAVNDSEDDNLENATAEEDAEEEVDERGEEEELLVVNEIKLPLLTKAINSTIERRQPESNGTTMTATTVMAKSVPAATTQPPATSNSFS